MTENMAARGEGLAGLVAKWRKEGDASKGVGRRIHHQFADELETEIAALEAAAPASTARMSGYELAGCADRSGVVVYLDGRIGNSRLMVAGDWDRFANEVKAALATPSTRNCVIGARILCAISCSRCQFCAGRG